MRGQERILGERHLRHRAAADAFLRHEREPERTPRCCAETAGGNAVQDDDLWVAEGTLARERRQKLLLAVARYSRDADDLAAAEREVDIGEIDAEGILRTQRQAAHGERSVAARGRSTVPWVRNVAADHHPREARWGLGSRLALSRVPS